jgi:cell division inhibitor SepF
MSVWKKTLLYLGLGPDEEYEDYDYDAPGVGSVGDDRRPAPAAAQVQREQRGGAEDPGNVRAMPTPRSGDPVEGAAPRMQPRAVRPMGSTTVRPRPAPPQANPHVVVPHGFNDAQEIADRFKSKQPVIVNLQEVERDLSRRLIDFASGLCYGLGGHMERVANQVYLLTPTDVQVTAEDRQRLAEQGFTEG